MIKSNNKVLLVEDNPDDEELARMAFEECPITNELIVARDGEEALDYLFAQGKYAGRDICEQPQVVLLDLKLPKVSGLEVLHSIRLNEQTKFQPVVVLTSSKEESDLVNSYSLGANSYIRKPVDFSQFTEVVRDISTYWLTHNESPACC